MSPQLASWIAIAADAIPHSAVLRILESAPLAGVLRFEVGFFLDAIGRKVYRLGLSCGSLWLQTETHSLKCALDLPRCARGGRCRDSNRHDRFLSWPSSPQPRIQPQGVDFAVHGQLEHYSSGRYLVRLPHPHPGCRAVFPRY